MGKVTNSKSRVCEAVLSESQQEDRRRSTASNVAAVEKNNCVIALKNGGTVS